MPEMNKRILTMVVIRIQWREPVRASRVNPDKVVQTVTVEHSRRPNFHRMVGGKAKKDTLET